MTAKCEKKMCKTKKKIMKWRWTLYYSTGHLRALIWHNLLQRTVFEDHDFSFSFVGRNRKIVKFGMIAEVYTCSFNFAQYNFNPSLPTSWTIRLHQFLTWYNNILFDQIASEVFLIFCQIKNPSSFLPRKLTASNSEHQRHHWEQVLYRLYRKWYSQKKKYSWY